MARKAKKAGEGIRRRGRSPPGGRGAWLPGPRDARHGRTRPPRLRGAQGGSPGFQHVRARGIACRKTSTRKVPPSASSPTPLPAARCRRCAPKIDDEECNFRSLGVETVPLTGTRVVKFRQQINGIPVFGSLVSVELDDHNELVSLNSSLAKPDLASYVAQDFAARCAEENCRPGRLRTANFPTAFRRSICFSTTGQMASRLYRRGRARAGTRARQVGIEAQHQIPLVLTTSSTR